MRLVNTAHAKSHFSQIARSVSQRKDPVVVTYRGKPYVVLEPVTDQDLEALAFEYSWEVRRLIQEAEADIRAKRFVTHEEYLAGKRSHRR